MHIPAQKCCKEHGKWTEHAANCCKYRGKYNGKWEVRTQNRCTYRGNGSFQLQNAANSMENGENRKSKKNPQTKKKNPQTISYPFSPTLPMCFPCLCLCCGYLGLLLVFRLLLLCLCFTYGLLAGISSALDISLFWLVEVNTGIVSNLKPPTKSNPWMISYPNKWGLWLSDAQNTCYYAHLNDTCF